MENKTGAAIYCRTAQACHLGIEAQETMLRQYASEHGYEDVRVYTDNGYSGLNLDRPAFTRMQSDIDIGIVQTIIVKDLSRISRNMIDMLEWLRNDGLGEVALISVMCGFESKVTNLLGWSKGLLNTLK
jgi:DNA invertase Pin-like site-specific DNA recombinase